MLILNQEERDKMEKNTVFGYCRVSTKSQKLERQVENLLKYEPTITIFKEKYTGTTTNRPAFNKLLKRVKPGDTIVFDSVSRMSRNAEEGWAIYKDLFTKGVNLVFLKEKLINTEMYAEEVNRAQMPLTGDDIDIILEAVSRYRLVIAEKQFKLAFDQAEKEVKDIQTRVKEGIRVARANGKQIGREPGTKVVSKKAKMLKQQIFEQSKDFNGDKKDVELLQTLAISRNSYYKYKKEIKEELM